MLPDTSTPCCQLRYTYTLVVNQTKETTAPSSVGSTASHLACLATCPGLVVGQLHYQEEWDFQWVIRVRFMIRTPEHWSSSMAVNNQAGEGYDMWVWLLQVVTTVYFSIISELKMVLTNVWVFTVHVDTYNHIILKLKILFFFVFTIGAFIPINYL